MRLSELDIIFFHTARNICSVERLSPIGEGSCLHLGELPVFSLDDRGRSVYNIRYVAIRIRGEPLFVSPVW